MATTVNGTALAIGIVIFVLGLAVFTYFGVPRLVIPYFEQKPAQTIEFLDRTSAALEAYYADHGAWPPVEELNFHRRRNKNLLRSRSYGIHTYRVSMLTTPVAYLNPRLSGDPYAMPEQSAPAGYFPLQVDGIPVAVLYSAGPNLKYNIRPPDLRVIDNRQALLAYLTAKAYDPTNGVRSGGDVWRLLEPTTKDETP
jgi:hypothetical protein